MGFSWVSLSPLLLPGVPEAWLLPAQLASKTHALTAPHELSKGPSFYSGGPENAASPQVAFMKRWSRSRSQDCDAP